MLMLDLCCGVKGASGPMVNRGWSVVTVDARPGVDPDIIADVKEWRWRGKRPDLIWCTPPIIGTKQPDLTAFLGCMRIINEARPRFWVVEGDRNAVYWLTPHLGRPAYVHNPYFLYGSFPHLEQVRAKGTSEKFAIANKIAVAIEESLVFQEVLI